VEDVPEDAALVRIEQVVEAEFVGGRDEIGPGGHDLEPLRVAGDVERRVFERGGVAGELGQRIIEIALVLLVLEGEEALLPDIGETAAAARLWSARARR